jgi:ABC-2 type transport system ATP-binding protein
VDVELRQSLWAFIRDLNRQGHSIILTTHYLEEAEALCSRVAMLKQGEIVALDSTANLLNRHVSLQLCLRLNPARLPQALHPLLSAQEGDIFKLALNHLSELETVLRTLREAGSTVEDMGVTKPDLEDVFLKIVQS